MDICTWNATGGCNKPLSALSFKEFIFIFIFSSSGCPATSHLHVHCPNLALFFLWVFSEHCESLLLLQLISVTVLNFSQLLNVLATQVPTLASLFFLSPAAPLPHSEFCSAFVLVWLFHLDCFLHLSTTQTSLKVILGVQGRAPLLSFCCRKLIVKRSNCRK